MKMKKCMAALLALVMLLGLAACGGGQQKEDEEENPGTTETPEFVYQAQYKTLIDDGENVMYPILFTEEGFYAERNEKVGEEPVPEGVVPEYEGEYDIYEYRYYFISYDGQVRKLDKFTPIPDAENTEGYKDFNCSSSIYGIVPNDDGTLTTLEDMYVNWYDGPEDLTRDDDEYWNYYNNSLELYIRRLDADGAELSRVKVEIEGIDSLNGNGIVTDSKGNILLNYFDENGGGIVALSPEGEKAYSVPTDFGGADNLVNLRDGRAAALVWGEQGMELRVLDAEKGAFGESLAVPRDAYDIIPGDEKYDFYYTSGVNLMGYNADGSEPVKLLNWLDCDVDSNEVNRFHVLSDGTVVAVENDSSGGEDPKMTTQLVTISLVPADTVPVKEHLTLAVEYLSYDLRRQVVEFNRNNDKCRIDVKDYSEYNTDDDPSAGTTKLTTEILSGNMPDLLYMSGMPYAQLAAKGLLEDLYPYLDADPELSRDDFFDSVLKAMETGGGLYQVCSAFGIISAVGPRSVIGDKTGWTYEELYAALDSMPEGCEIFSSSTTKDDALRMCMYLNMDSFLDWTTGQCSFDSEDFIKILEFTDNFPLEYNYDDYDPSEDSDMSRISQGKQLLMQTSLSSFDEIQYSDLYFGGEGSAVFVGLPTTDGSSGSAIIVSDGTGMSSKCADKEAGWQFLRTFLTEEYAEEYGYGGELSVNKNTFMENLEEASTPRYRTDANGNYVLDENGEKIEENRGGVSFGDGTSFEIYALSQGQSERLLNLVQNNVKSVQFNENLFELIDQEVQAYFNGQKSAQETAKLIQSKVNIYVNEQR